MNWFARIAFIGAIPFHELGHFDAGAAAAGGPTTKRKKISKGFFLGFTPWPNHKAYAP